MGLLCPLLMALPVLSAQAQNWQSAYDMSSQNIAEIREVTAKGNTFVAYGMDNESDIATIVYSTDGGNNFNILKKYKAGNTEGQPADSVFFTGEPAINSEGHLFAPTLNGMYKSTDGGANYTAIYKKSNRSITDVDFAGNIGIAIAKVPLFNPC